jgi:hypothetical protein
MMPVMLPGAPSDAVATASGATQATVTFAAPASNGGGAITGYTVTSDPTGAVDSSAGATTLAHVMTGLVGGTAYTFTVTATNAIGTSAPSAASNGVTPAVVVLPGAPGAPATVVAALSGVDQATVTFAAPASDGGAEITGYTVTSSPAGGVDTNAGSTTTSHLVTGLVRGTAYTFTVVATNAAGASAASPPSNSLTPPAEVEAGTDAAGPSGSAMTDAGSRAGQPATPTSPTSLGSPGTPASDAASCSCRVVATPQSPRSGFLALAGCAALVLAARSRRQRR